MRHRLFLLLFLLFSSTVFGQHGFSVATEKALAATRLPNGNFLGAMANADYDLEMVRFDGEGNMLEAHVVNFPAHYFTRVGSIQVLDADHVLVTAQGTDSMVGVTKDHLIRINTLTLEGEMASTPVLSYMGVPEVRLVDGQIYISYSDFQFSRIEKRDLNLTPLFADTILMDTLGKTPTMGLHVQDTHVVIIAKSDDECTLYHLTTEGEFVDCFNFEESGYTRVYDIVGLPGGDFVIGGLRGDDLVYNHKAILCRMSLSGDVVWARKVDSLMTVFTAVKLLPDGQIAAFGMRDVNLDGNSSMFNVVCLFDENGNLQRSIYFGTTLTDDTYYTTLTQLADGFVMGGTKGTAMLGYTYPLTFTDFSFSQVCLQTELTLPTSDHDMGILHHQTLAEVTFSPAPSSPIAAMPSPSAVAGESTTVLCSPVLSVNDGNASIVLPYPNPVMQGESVFLSGSNGTGVNWRVLDLQGRIMMTGIGASPISTSQLQQGLYLIEVETPDGQVLPFKLMVR
jgi:hypothetical protein